MILYQKFTLILWKLFFLPQNNFSDLPLIGAPGFKYVISGEPLWKNKNANIPARNKPRIYPRCGMPLEKRLVIFYNIADLMADF